MSSCSTFGRYLISQTQSSIHHLPANAIVYVVGGLYGNHHALLGLKERISKETSGGETIVCFNGDFNFFNSSVESWNAVNHDVLKMGKETSIVGNVERAVCESKVFEQCGCDYPPYVDENVPKWANEITKALHGVAWNGGSDDSIRNELLKLPPYRILTTHSGARIAILHGDLTSLSGWNLALEMMEPLDDRIRRILRVPRHEWTRQSAVLHALTDSAHVDLVACTHTCVAFAQFVAGSNKAIFNNGSAGIPNFANMPGIGLITRISTRSGGGAPPSDSLYGAFVGDSSMRVDAIPIKYDHDAFMKSFTSWGHGPKSPAYLSYFNRLQKGLSWWSVQDAGNRLARSQQRQRQHVE